jgi:hypothetical protein
LNRVIKNRLSEGDDFLIRFGLMRKRLPQDLTQQIGPMGKTAIEKGNPDT